MRSVDIRRVSFSGDLAAIDRPNSSITFQGHDINLDDDVFYFGQNTDTVGSGIQFFPLSNFDNPLPTTQSLITVDEILGLETELDVNWLQFDPTLDVV